MEIKKTAQHKEDTSDSPMGH